MTELVTRRLELRPWRDADLDEYAAIVADPRVMQFMGAGPLDRATAWRQMAIFIGHREMRGYTQSAVIERSTGRLVGRAGLFRPEGWPDLEVGWVLAPTSWGRGYASELGRACRDFAFGVLRAQHVISLIVPDNTASIRVAQAIGSHLEGETLLNGDLHLVYGQAARNPGQGAAAESADKTLSRRSVDDVDVSRRDA